MTNEKFVEDQSAFEGGEDIEFMDSLPGGSGNFIGLPKVGERLLIIVRGLVVDKNPKFKTKEGIECIRGFVDKKTGKIISVDVVTTDNKKFNLKGAMVYYGVKFKLDEYKKIHGTYENAQIEITHNYNGAHANTVLGDLQKIKEFATMEETIKYQNEVKLAMKEFRIYDIKLLN